MYEECGINGVIDEFFAIVRDRKRRMLYAVNINLQERLKTTRDIAMDEMKSFMEHLPGGSCIGINTPGAFVGQEGTSFNPHIEDCAFPAVNRHVAGAAKIW